MIHAPAVLADPFQESGVPQVRQGVVTTVEAATCTVTIGGSAIAIANARWLASAPPVVGQTVWVYREKGELPIVLGPVSGQGGAPAVQARRTTNLSVNNTTDTVVNLEAVDVNVGTWWTVGTPARLFAPLSGWYVGRGVARWATSASAAERYATARVNGVALNRMGEQGNGYAGVVTLGFALFGKLNAGDYVEMVVFQATGAALNLTPTFTHSVELALVWVRPV